MTKREYILSTYPAVNRAAGTSVREVKERTGDGEWRVILTVASYDAMDVMDALRDAYQNGREDHAEDTDVQPQERWKALKGWLQDRIRSLEADAQNWGNDRMAETFRAKADAYRAVLVQMGEQEAGR